MPIIEFVFISYVKLYISHNVIVLIRGSVVILNSFRKINFTLESNFQFFTYRFIT